jgi:GNAT superfamily N-acetyltransferase
MIVIRPYHEQDAPTVGRLIADTYSAFNLSFVPSRERGPFLGPFQHAYSPEGAHRKAIARVIQAEVVFVAEDGDQTVGVLRGRKERLASLFVRGNRHRQGIGRELVARFEAESLRRGVTVIRVASTLYAVPFYLKMGYKCSTGVRAGWSFEGVGLRYQPMRKELSEVRFFGEGKS